MKFFLSLLFFLPLASNAQEFFNFLSPDSPSTTLELEGVYLPTSDIEGGADQTQVLNTGIGATQRIYKGDQTQIAVGAKYQKLDLTAESPLLRDYYNQQGSVSFKRDLKDDKFWLASLSYGSASDRPFKSNRDNTLSANYIQKINSKWFVAGNYSNNRTFLNNIPIPGFFYVKEMSRERTFVIGFPFLYIVEPLSSKWTLRYLGILPWSHRLKLLYTKWKFIKPYLGLEQSPQTYFRHDRDSRYNRFFWFERRASLGVESGLGRSLKFDLFGGYAFDRQFFEARNFSQSKDFLINLENSYFIGLNVRYNFY